MNEWKEYKLKDVANVKYGKAHQSLSDGYIPAYGSGGLIRYVEKALYNEESILIPRKGTLNNIIYKDEPFWTVDTMFWTELNKKIIVPKYLFYQLSLIDFSNMNVGSAVPSMTIPILNDIDIYVPSIPEQTAIASILSSLDDKIDLLHRQNVTLEKMAETLFRQWFVEEAKEDWVRTKIGDVLDTVLGGTPSTKKPEYWDGNIPWINSGEVNNFRILQCSRFITELGLKKSNTKLLPVGTTVLAITGATLGQVSLLEIDTCANQSVVGIIPNGTLPKEFIFLWIKMKISEIILSETGGAQPHINKNDINETDIVIPDSDYLNKIKLTIEPLFKKITHNSFQIRTLTALRDTLLPKLMSGEVRVD